MIREARREDIPRVYELVLELAEYERLRHMVSGTAEDLARHVFETHACRLMVKETEAGIVGYALYFFNFSTFLMRPGLYLEDFYVTPSERGKGFGKALLLHLLEEARAMGCGRMEWSVLDWNQPAIDFYRSLGAQMLDDWKTCRITIS